MGLRASAESVVEFVQVWQQELRRITHGVGVHLGDVGWTEGLLRIGNKCRPSEAGEPQEIHTRRWGDVGELEGTGQRGLVEAMML